MSLQEKKEEKEPARTLPFKEPTTKQEMRMAVADDVLKQLEFRSITADSVYCCAQDVSSKVYNTPLADLRKELGMKELARQAKCHVCGIGSAALSMAEMGMAGDVSLSSMNKAGGYDSMHRIMSSCFSSDVIASLECAFEGNYIGGFCQDEHLKRRTREWAARHRLLTPNQRLAAIWQNIYDNKGEWKP